MDGFKSNQNSTISATWLFNQTMLDKSLGYHLSKFDLESCARKAAMNGGGNEFKSTVCENLRIRSSVASRILSYSFFFLVFIAIAARARYRLGGYFVIHHVARW